MASLDITLCRPPQHVYVTFLLIFETHHSLAIKLSQMGQYRFTWIILFPLVSQDLHMALNATLFSMNSTRNTLPGDLTPLKDLVVVSNCLILSNLSLTRFVLCFRQSILIREYTQDTEVSEQQEFKKCFTLEEFDRSRCSNIEVGIVAYRGKLSNPRWVDKERGEYILSPGCVTLTPYRIFYHSVYHPCRHIETCT